MRRFSDRNALVTLSDINITPLLDLAFVLLIIFMITTPLLDQGIDLSLPQGGSPDLPIKPEQVRVVEVSAEGKYYLNQTEVNLADLSSAMSSAFQANPGIIVHLRADKTVEYGRVMAVLDLLKKLGIPDLSLRTESQ